MLYRLKCLTLATLVLSLSCCALSAKGFVVQHTLAPTATPNKATADKFYQQGLQQYRQGCFPLALKTYLEALTIYRQLGDKAGIAQTLNNMGEAYNGLEKYDQALFVLQQALAIRQQLKDRKGEGETLDNIGSVYDGLKKYDKEQEILQQALAIRREVKDRAGEGKTLRKIGGNYHNLKQYPLALVSLQQALAINREVLDRYQEGITLYQVARVYSFGKQEYTSINAGLAMVYRDLNQPNVAIAYYKDAINGIQQVRRNISGLPPQLQISFLQANSDIYRQLADLLRQLGLNTEALQVVELLKIQELREFTRSVDTKPAIPLSRGEQQIKQVQSNLIAFGQRVYECEQQKCPQLQSLITQRDNLNKEFIKKRRKLCVKLNLVCCMERIQGEMLINVVALMLHQYRVNQLQSAMPVNFLIPSTGHHSF